MYAISITGFIAVIIYHFCFTFFSIIVYIIYNCLCRGASATIQKEFLFQNILTTLFFNEQKGHNSLFHLLYFNVLVYTSSLNVCLSYLVLTFNSTSIICSSRTHVKLFFRKLQWTFISLAML